MAIFKVGIIGSGGRGIKHAKAYATSEDVEIVACADVKRENAEALAKEHNIPESKIYSDYKQMLAKEKLDLISICTWAKTHAEITIAAAESGVKAIHSEKPMAPTWGEAKKMYQACVDNDVALSVSHQRRFGPTFVRAKELANDGTIGELRRVEGFCSNLFDWGTHWFDMFFFYNNDQPAEWVMGQISLEKDSRVFQVPVESHGLSYIKWKNGVYGLLVTGPGRQFELGGCSNRLIGTKGIIELDAAFEKTGRPLVRVMHEGASGWEAPDIDLTGEAMKRGASGWELIGGQENEQAHTTLSILDLIECLKKGRESAMSGRKALQATELIFATYESSRRRARIHLPLEIEDSPLISMLEAGIIGPKAEK